MEIKNKFFLESITCATFKTLNAQVPRKTSTFDFLTYVLRTQVNISLIKNIWHFWLIA